MDKILTKCGPAQPGGQEILPYPIHRETARLFWICVRACAIRKSSGKWGRLRLRYFGDLVKKPTYQDLYHYILKNGQAEKTAASANLYIYKFYRTVGESIFR